MIKKTTTLAIKRVDKKEITKTRVCLATSKRYLKIIKTMRLLMLKCLALQLLKMQMLLVAGYAKRPRQITSKLSKTLMKLNKLSNRWVPGRKTLLLLKDLPEAQPLFQNTSTWRTKTTTEDWKITVLTVPDKLVLPLSSTP